MANFWKNWIRKIFIVQSLRCVSMIWKCRKLKNSCIIYMVPTEHFQNALSSDWRNWNRPCFNPWHCKKWRFWNPYGDLPYIPEIHKSAFWAFVFSCQGLGRIQEACWLTPTIIGFWKYTRMSAWSGIWWWSRKVWIAIIMTCSKPPA